MSCFPVYSLSDLSDQCLIRSVFKHYKMAATIALRCRLVRAVNDVTWSVSVFLLASSVEWSSRVTNKNIVLASGTMTAHCLHVALLHQLRNQPALSTYQQRRQSAACYGRKKTGRKVFTKHWCKANSSIFHHLLNYYSPEIINLKDNNTAYPVVNSKTNC